MNLVELIFALGIIATLASSAYIAKGLSLRDDSRSALTTLYAIKHARLMALIDSSNLGHHSFGDKYLFARVDSRRLLSEVKPFFWQLQFHTSGIYTKNSLSIYRDTPRFATTTDYDRRPLAGDIVALNILNSQCLSGYNNTNITGFCRNNASIDFRLNEIAKLQYFGLQGNSICLERDTFRFYFNDFGAPLCGYNISYLNRAESIQVGVHVISIEPLTGYVRILK